MKRKDETIVDSLSQMIADAKITASASAYGVLSAMEIALHDLKRSASNAEYSLSDSPIIERIKAL